MTSRSVAFVLFCVLDFGSAVIYRLNDIEHDVMPPIVHLDPYERCLRQPAGVYCTGYVSFVSDQPSALLKQMQDYSAYTIRHFNYTRALYGTCVSDKCTLETNAEPKRTLEACLNRTMWKNYKLRVKVENGLHCVTGKDRKNYLDTAGVVVIIICLVLLILNAIGSLYDIYSTEKKHHPAAYILLCFSLRRNWKDLVASADISKDSREIRLQGLNGMRAISLFLVVLGHSLMYPVLVTNNHLFFEKQYDYLPVHLLINGSLVMQRFLVLSSFLMAYNALKAEETYQARWMTLPSKIFKRWLRLTPPNALLLAVTATWLNNVGDGPLWNLMVSTEARDCRRYWWTHLLYINNYFDKSKCMPQAWYLAADFQLSCLGLAIYSFFKSPRMRNVVLSTLFVMGIAMSGLHTYFQDLDPALIVRPNSITSFFANDPTFHNSYKRSHTNLPSYVLGMALGYFVYKLQKDSSKHNLQKWRPVFWAMLPISYGILMLCKVFYTEMPRMDVRWRTAVATVIRPAYGLTMAVILAGTVLKIENVYRGFLEWRGWTTMARVSYSAYQIHMAFLNTITGMEDTLVPGTYIGFGQKVLLILVLTYVSAYVFYLTVESPLNKVVKLCLVQTSDPMIKSEEINKKE